MPARRGIYRTIAQDLRQKIQDGTYTYKLPSMGAIAQQYVVDRSVAVRAVKMLQAEHTVDIVWGSGVYVAGRSDPRPLTERIIEMMREEKMTVGSPFPTEHELADELGTSRTRLRPALAKLEGRGLIGTRGSRRRIVLALPDKEES